MYVVCACVVGCVFCCPHSQRKEQRKNTIAAAATAAGDTEGDEGGEGEPPAKKQRTEEEEREWVSRLGGRGQRNREWFDEERKKGQVEIFKCQPPLTI